VTRALRWFVNGVQKNALAGLVDAAITAVAYFVALALRTGLRFETVEFAPALVLCLLAGAFQVLGNILTDVYWREWRFVSLRDAFALLKAAAVAGAAILGIDVASEGAQRNLPISTIPIGAMLSAGFLLAYRLRDRLPAIARVAASGSGTENVLIVGAGDMGQLLARDLEDSSSPYRVRTFVDAEPGKVGTYIRGHRVDGTLNDIPRLVRSRDINIVAVAIQNPSGSTMQQIVEACDSVDVQIRKVSRLRDALTGVSLELERLEPEDLLRRSTVRVDEQRCRSLLENKSVLITGAAGSIGSELARQVLQYAPGHLTLVDVDESRLFDLSMELHQPQEVSIRLADVRDRASVERVFRATHVDIVFHAAALKHAPLLESHVVEAIDTNVIGTLNVAEAASGNGVERFVFIGTDKAVEPQGVMGATKRIGELVMRSLARESATTFAIVRFGNVLGSRGSVVPLFLSQIQAGGPVTVTDEHATRYFMTVGEAAALVLEAASIARNGDVFMLEMGQPILIVELARRLVRARGLRVGRDVEIQVVGLRPGEKLHERLRFDYERAVPTEHPLVIRLEDDIKPWSPQQLSDVLTDVRSLVRAGEDDSARAALFEIVHVTATSDKRVAASTG
jgi:FlaA1/EpsC-like NDP-sugar epimerase